MEAVMTPYDDEVQRVSVAIAPGPYLHTITFLGTRAAAVDETLGSDKP
jgi:hypothetical protein